MKIAVSILGIKDDIDKIREIECSSADYIHLDIMDGKFVSNKTMPYSELKNIYKYTSKRLDVHLMVEDPEKYIPLYATLNTEYIVFHVEVDKDITKLLKMIKQYGIKAGLSIKPNTKVNELVPYLPYLDMVLVMSVEPGKGGQTFIEESEERIKEVRELLKSYNIPAVINVDGGVNDKTISKCRDADIVTAGSYIIGSDNFQTKISSLR